MHKKSQSRRTLGRRRVILRAVGGNMKPVKVTKATKGMIFLLEDQCKSKTACGASYAAHNYLVLGGDGARYQCMSITSLAGKTRTTEVPILLSNGKVSYIITNQIYTHPERKFSFENFHGIISEGVDEFIQLLMDLYIDSLNIAAVKHEDVVRRYNTYCKNFFDSMPGYIEESKPATEETAETESSESSDGGFRITIPPEIYEAVRVAETKEKGDDEFKEMIHRHPKYWETNDLQNFIKMMESHNSDTKFKMEFLGVSKPQSVHQKVYLARKELRARQQRGE